MNTPLLRIRSVVLQRPAAGSLQFSLPAETWLYLDREGVSTGLHPIPLETWLWLRLLVGPLVEYAVAHGGHLPPDGMAVHLVLRAAHLAAIRREEIQDLRPDPLVTMDSEPPLTAAPGSR